MAPSAAPWLEAMLGPGSQPVSPCASACSSPHVGQCLLNEAPPVSYNSASEPVSCSRHALRQNVCNVKSSKAFPQSVSILHCLSEVVLLKSSLPAVGLAPTECSQQQSRYLTSLEGLTHSATLGKVSSGCETHLSACGL